MRKLLKARATRWLLGIAAAGLLAWGGYWAVAVYALGRALSDCSSDVLSEAVSPDQQYVATAFERGCGATTPFVRIVSVRATRTRFDGDDRDRWVFAVEGQPEIRLAWTDPERLTIKHGGGRVSRQAVVWYGLSVSYE